MKSIFSESGGSWLHNQFSAFICIMHGLLRRYREKFSSPFIFFILGTEWRRLTLQNISNHITCDQSNVVIILRPYSFPSNEYKSTPSLLASDSSCKEDVTSTMCLISPPFFRALFEKPISFSLSFYQIAKTWLEKLPMV